MMQRQAFRPDDKVKRIIRLLTEGGASDCLLVGGFVRDHYLGLPSKDVDIEIYGLSYGKILKILRPHFRVGLVGQSFGTVKVDNEIDLSIPRIEKKDGLGHKGFDVSSDPDLDPYTAFSRRDFTINAIGIRIDGSVYDPFDGLGDLQRRILRAPTEAFCEDPLRVLRAMQFAARFGFDMEPKTVELCKRVRSEFDTLSAERVWGEWSKWATKGRFPRKGLLLLQETGWIDCFPEIAALVGVPQNPEYHPEGDAFVHTTLVCEAAVPIADRFAMNEDERTILMFAALCHDFGKPATTIRNEKGNWSSPRHAAEGVAPAVAFLERMKAPHRVIDHVRPLVREHLAHQAVPEGEVPGFRSVRRLAARLEPSNIRMWCALGRADARGDGRGEPRYRLDSWEEIAEKLDIQDAKAPALLRGRDLLELGFQSGPEMGKLLHAAYEAQLDGVFDDLEGAIAWAKGR